MIRIFVDADACPVKKEIERISTRHNIKTFLVCNGGVRPPISPNIKLVVVKQNLDAADHWIINNISCMDICVTNDIILAESCIKKGALIIKPNGSFYTENNIGVAIATRRIKETIRDKGQITNPIPQFSKADRSKFLDQMEHILQKIKKQITTK